MNLKHHPGNVTGDTYAQAMSLVKIDDRYLVAGVDLVPVLGCLDAPAEISTGRMVHVGAQHTAGCGLIPAGEFQVLTQRDGWRAS